MGLIAKIKEFFKEDKPEKSEDKKIHINNLENWLNEKKEDLEKNLEEKTNNLYNELSSFLQKLEGEVSILEKFNTDEKKEHEKVKQITELGKKDYAQAVRKLVENLKEKKEMPFISNEIDKFAGYSAKSHLKATYLIGKEIEDITNTIISIRKLENNFLKNNEMAIKNKNIIKLLIEKNNERKENIEIKNRIIDEIGKMEEEISENEKEIGEINNKIKEMEKSQQAQRKESLIKEKKSKEDELKNLEFSIRKIIDKRILEKYFYLNQNQTEKDIENYIEDPITALLSDNKLIIKNILEDCIQKIKGGMIRIKDPDKIINKISSSKDSLGNYKNSIKDIRKEIQYIEKQINAIQLDIKSIQNEKLQKEIRLEESKSHLGALLKKQEKTENKINEITFNIAEELKLRDISLISRVLC